MASRDVLARAAVKHQEEQREQEDGEARSSNKMGKKGKKRKRRKKKLPKIPSSRGVGDQDTMFEYAEDETRRSKGILDGGELLLAWKRWASRRR